MEKHLKKNIESFLPMVHVCLQKETCSYVEMQLSICP